MRRNRRDTQCRLITRLTHQLLQSALPANSKDKALCPKTSTTSPDSKVDSGRPNPRTNLSRPKPATEGMTQKQRPETPSTRPASAKTLKRLDTEIRQISSARRHVALFWIQNCPSVVCFCLVFTIVDE